MSNYSVPKEIRELRPKGTTVKALSDRYYVYEYSSTKKKVLSADGSYKWKTFTKMGKCIGQITAADGFIPNGNSISNSEITVLEYGGYALVHSFAGKTLQILKETFNAADANQIYAVASIFVVEGFTHMKNIGKIFGESFLSKWNQDVHVGYDALKTLYYELGRHGEKISEFEQKLIDSSSRRIAIDGHVIACTSSKNDLSAFGYKAAKIGTEQINWMCAYDIETNRPLTSQMFDGSVPDKTSVQAMFSRFLFRDTLFVADRGFNTDADKKLMSGCGNSYIIPMVSGRKDYEFVYSRLSFNKRRNFIYDKDGYSSLIYYQEILNDGYRYIAYKDTTRASAERQTYIKKITEGIKGYSEEKLEENEKDFGLFILETSDMKKTAQNVFRDYKSRWKIETFYEYIDNSLDFNTLYQQDYCRMQGLGFIVHVAGMIYHDLRKVTDSKNLHLRDVMNELKGIKASKERGRWVVRNDTKHKRDICEQLGLLLPRVL